MNNVFKRLEAFFFTERSATGFGLMRIAWALSAFLTSLMMWNDVMLYFSEAGYLPSSMMPMYLRSIYRFTIFDWVTGPGPVFLVYLVHLAALLCAMIGYRTRWSVGVSVLLLFSFHERNPLVLAGGDTVLRLVGFILLISPGIEALSVDRMRLQWRHWRKTLSFLPALTMPDWPYRLLLWQFIVLYGTSLWYKSLGSMWMGGTAVASVLHHPIFARIPLAFMDVLAPLAPPFGFAALLWHAGWLLLLVPRKLFHRVSRWSKAHLKRLLLLGGVVFHGSIFLLLRAGCFSWAVLSGYLGLLDGHDLNVLRRIFGGASVRKVTILYDGHCGLCLRSVFTLQLLDAFHRLQPVNFWNRNAKNVVAPRLTESQLDRAMHIKKSGRFYKGFDAFRELAWDLPALWPLIPILHLPGMRPLGRLLYAAIAARRKTCTHKRCAL